MQRVWLIRAGDEAQQIDSMRHAGLIGLRYEEVGDATALTAAEIEQALIDAKRPAPAQHRAQIESFVREVRLGNLVVTPNTSRGEVWLSVVTGDYRFDPNPRVEGYCHTHTVDWLGCLDRDVRWMKDQVKVIDQPVGLVEMYNREWWWKVLDTHQLSPIPRAVLSKPSTARPRSLMTSKPKPAPKPKPVALVLCAGQCGLQWSPYVLVDGLCADCRGD